MKVVAQKAAYACTRISISQDYFHSYKKKKVERIAEAAHVWPSGVGNGPNSSAVWGSAQLPLVRSLGGGIVV